MIRFIFLFLLLLPGLAQSDFLAGNPTSCGWYSRSVPKPTGCPTYTPNVYAHQVIHPNPLSYYPLEYYCNPLAYPGWSLVGFNKATGKCDFSNTSCAEGQTRETVAPYGCVSIKTPLDPPGAAFCGPEPPSGSPLCHCDNGSLLCLKPDEPYVAVDGTFCLTPTSSYYTGQSCSFTGLNPPGIEPTPPPPTDPVPGQPGAPGAPGEGGQGGAGGEGGAAGTGGAGGAGGAGGDGGAGGAGGEGGQGGAGGDATVTIEQPTWLNDRPAWMDEVVTPRDNSDIISQLQASGTDITSAIDTSTAQATSDADRLIDQLTNTEDIIGQAAGSVVDAISAIPPVDLDPLISTVQTAATDLATDIERIMQGAIGEIPATDLTGVTDRIGQLEGTMIGSIDGLGTKVDTIGGTLTGIGTGVDRIGTGVDRIGTGIDDIGGTLDQIKEGEPGAGQAGQGQEYAKPEMPELDDLELPEWGVVVSNTISRMEGLPILDVPSFGCADGGLIQCQSLNLSVLGRSFSLDFHCTVMQDILPMINAALWAAAAVSAVLLFLS